MGAEPKAVGPSSVMKLFYIFLNVFSAVSIVFANKLVLTTYRWIAIAPTVMLLDFVLFRKMQTWRIMASVAVVCVGVTAATVTDHVAISNVVGLGVGLASVVVTALYQIWAGSKQKELQANSSQLLLAYTPQTSPNLPFLAPHPCTYVPLNNLLSCACCLLLQNKLTRSVSAIVISALLGILVSLSTFLVIGATSSLTYNIVGHFKTVNPCVYLPSATPALGCSCRFRPFPVSPAPSDQ
eukprot:XP_001703085.1 solute carrier protein [Chlamydomonas reinhardtii]